MKSLGELLRTARNKKGLILRKVAAAVDIDQSLISKFEKNERRPTKKQLIRLADFYDLSKELLTISWYSEKIAEELKDSDTASEILKVAEEKINYYKSKKDDKE